MTSLLLGAGHNRTKKVSLVGSENWTGDLVTLDMGPGCDILWDLENRPLPFKDEEFDELAAYDVLEHIGKQGDWRGWFDEMAEYHRILKPGGLFSIMVPIGEDRFADPGHTRFLALNNFVFLSQSAYEDAISAGLPVTDYRWYWKKNFTLLCKDQIGDHHLAGILRKE